MSPVEVVVAEIGSTMILVVLSGCPRRFMVMKLNIRCSIRFHLEVPGG